jgi:thymidine phosphorylase
MGRVLGRSAGNALEIAESVRSLQEGPEKTAADLREITLALGSGMLELSGVFPDEASARRSLEEVWRDGRGFQRFRRMVEHLGGDTAVIDDPTRLPRATHLVEVESPDDGCLLGLAARVVGDWITESGGGRLRKNEPIDPRVGVELLADLGERVEAGQPVLRLHLRAPSGGDAELRKRAQSWVELGEGSPGPWVLETVDP